MSEAGPQVNGLASPTGKYIDLIDPDDPEYIKNLQRPAEVKEDLQQMENRSRVKVILNSQAFKEELEQVVEEQLRSGPFPASLIALQQITDLLLPNSKGGLASLARASAVIPINDLRGVESLGFAKGEKLLRCKLAALYRLVDLCGWSHGIHNHITARVSAENEHFLLSPFGLTYSEVTASSLVKVDVNGDVVDPGSTHLGSYKAGFSVHAAIHQARPDIKCIVHLHTPAAVAVSALKCGLLPISQEALICGNISYHDFQGVTIDGEEREKLVRNLGVHNKILVLRNRGILACGETVEEAFHYTSNVMAACEIQVKAIPLGLDNIVIPSEEAREQAHKKAIKGSSGGEAKERKWKTGELEFEALMRSLDNSGYRTGYGYKMPVVKQEKKDRSNSEVEIPPASSSFTYIFDGDYLHSKYASPIQAAKERQKNAFKAGWMTTPNAYKKTEIEEIGTTTPKKITKWVPEGDSPNRPGGTPIKIENPNQFAPQGDNPKEFKLKQKSIRKDYYEEKVTAGPQSKILEGITWDEVQKAKDGQMNVSGDQLIVVGAASKGIIQRDHQHNAVLYRNFYAANPFENMSEAEMEQYQAEVQRKERGEPVEEQMPPVLDEVSSIEQAHEPERQDIDVAEGTSVEKATNELLEVTRPSYPSSGHALNFEENQETHVTGTSCDYISLKPLDHSWQEVTDSLLQQNVNHSEDSQVIYDHNKHKCSEEFLLDQHIESVVGSDKDKDFNIVDHPDAQSFGRAHIDVHHAESTTWGERCFIAQEVYCQEPASNSENDLVTIQLNPIQLYHGHSDHGMMKVRFSIQSTVRRRVRSELSRGGTVEEVYSSISEPFIEHFEASNDSLEHHGVSGGHNLYVRHVNIWKSVGNKIKPAGQYKQPRRPPHHTESQTSRVPEVSGNGTVTTIKDHTQSHNPPESTGQVEFVLPGIHSDDTLLTMSEAVRLNSGLEETVRQTPSGSHVVGTGDKRSDKYMRVTSSMESKSGKHHSATSSYEGSQKYHTSTSNVEPDKEGTSFDRFPLVTSIQSDHVHDDDNDDDIMYADEGIDDNLVSVKEQQVGQDKETKIQAKPVFQKRGEKEKILNRKFLPPPPPLPPLLKPQSAGPNRKQLKQKRTHIYPPLSSVKEEFGGTVEEMEEMEAILDGADDSFEQLLISAEDELLVSPKADQDPYDGRLDLADFQGAAPMTLEEDFDFCEVYNNVLSPLSLGSIKHTKEIDNFPLKVTSSIPKGKVRLPHDNVSSERQEKIDVVSKDEVSKMTDKSLKHLPNEGRPTVEGFPSLDPGVDYFIFSKKKEPDKTSLYIERQEILETITRETKTNTPEKDSLTKQGASPSQISQVYVDTVIPCAETEIDEIIPLNETKINEIISLAKGDGLVPSKETGINEIISPAERDKIILPRETEIDYLVISKIAENNDMPSVRKTETKVGSLPKSKKVDSNEFIIENADDIKLNRAVYSKKTETVPCKQMLNIDEGPVQTSSPKLGRVKSKDSPFKPYLQKLGKSEETLLDIMPLKGQKPQISAKSHEELEGTEVNDVLESLLSRSKSLGPHHVTSRNKQKQANPNLPTKSKETLINDFLDSGSPQKESFHSPRAFLTEHALMRHCEMMKLSSARGVFKPSPQISPPWKGEVMPPLPDTTEVPSVSDNEESGQPHLTSRKPVGRVDPVVPHSVVSTNNSAPKQRWVPKQKRERRRGQPQGENYRRDEPINRQDGSFIEDGKRIGQQRNNDIGGPRNRLESLDDDKNYKPQRRVVDTQITNDNKLMTDGYDGRMKKYDEKRKEREKSFVKENEKPRRYVEEENIGAERKSQKGHEHIKDHDEPGTHDNDDFKSDGRNYSSSRDGHHKNRTCMRKETQDREGIELEEKMVNHKKNICKQNEKQVGSRKLTQEMEENLYGSKEKLADDLYVNGLGETHHKVSPEIEQSIVDDKHLALKRGLDIDRTKRDEREEVRRKVERYRQKYDVKEDDKLRPRRKYHEDRSHDDDRKKWRRREKLAEKSEESDSPKRENYKTHSDVPELDAFTREDSIEIRKDEPDLKSEKPGGRITNKNDVPEMSTGDSDVTHVHKKELAPVDKFLSSHRMEIDPENSPRLQKRRGGAIAQRDDYGRRKGKGKREEFDERKRNKQTYNKLHDSTNTRPGIRGEIQKDFKKDKDAIDEMTGVDCIAVNKGHNTDESACGSGIVPSPVVDNKVKDLDVKDENKECDDSFHKKDRSIKEVESDSDVFKDKHDENRKSDLYKNNKNKQTSEAEKKRDGGRWQPAKSRTNSSDADNDREMKYDKLNVQKLPKTISEERAVREEQVYLSGVQDEKILNERTVKRLKKPDLRFVGKINPYKDTDNDEDDESPEPFVRGQEQPKYAGFVRRSGRGVRNSQPKRNPASRNGGRDKRSQDEDEEDSKITSRNKSDTIASPHEDQVQGFDSLIHDNPIDISIDENLEDDEEKPHPKKKSVFNLLSCVGGKSSRVAKGRDKHKQEKPKAYYEEGEKKKIKKLSREKKKEERSLHYFEQSEDDLENVGNYNNKRGTVPETKTEDATQQLPLMPEAKFARKSERYTKKASFQQSKPLSTFTDPAEVLESLTSLNEYVDSSMREQGNLSQSDGVANIERPKQPELTLFQSFGKSATAKNSASKHDHGNSSQTELNAPHAYSKNKWKKKEDKVDMDSSFEESELIQKGKPANNSYEDIAREDQLNDSRDGEVELTSITEIRKNDIGEDIQETENNEIVECYHSQEIRLNDSVADFSPISTEEESAEKQVTALVDTTSTPPAETFTSDYQPFHHSSSAPAQINTNQQQASEQSLLLPQDNSIIEPHLLNSSYDPSTLFEAVDVRHRTQHRTVSFDDGFHALKKQISETSLGSESTVSRPRSTSSVTNPLIYEPWRAKADKKKRSLSISEMVYAKGVPRSIRTHSIGEGYSSTVASSVARRRARTSHSGDITSRMYQPRHHNRSHSSLGDTSFSSSRPYRQRQRSFSGFDSSSRSPASLGSTLLASSTYLSDRKITSDSDSSDDSDSSVTAVTVKRSESDRQTSTSPQIVDDLQYKNVEKSKPVQQQKSRDFGEDKPVSQNKSDTLKSADSASGGETLEERSSKEGSPTKEKPSPTKEKKKKKKFHIPSFSKKKSKEHKESTA